MISSDEKNDISIGDKLVVYIGPEDLECITITQGSILHNRAGRFRHDDLVGKPFGTRWLNIAKDQHVYALRLCPELWTRVLPHRTQIIYLHDIAFISELLDLKPGSIVVESGTGSGSFSHHISQIIAPKGHLYTFDYHEQRVLKAKEEFSSHNLSSIVTCIHRDVCKDGFGSGIEADCVFLDLPAPWEALEHAKAVLKKNVITKICCFSPCTEQVQKTCKTMKEIGGFAEIEMFECLVREHFVDVIALSKKEKLKINHKIKRLKTKENEMTEIQNDNDGHSPTIIVTKPKADMRGHTSFLLFAKIVPNL